MIRREIDGGWLLIPQAAHAWAAGIIARHWGNSVFARPEPFEAIVLAVTMHDNGWMVVDGDPPLNAHGVPMDFLEPPLDVIRAAYLRAVSHTAQVDPYAGVLVNRHIRFIFESRAERGSDSWDDITPLLNDLRHQQAQAITFMQQHPVYSDYLDEARIEANYRILRICDLLSLFLCKAFPARDEGDRMMQSIRARLFAAYGMATHCASHPGL